MICAAPLIKGPNKGKTATGTYAGYHRHQHAGEPACGPCAVAAKEYNPACKSCNSSKGARRAA